MVLSTHVCVAVMGCGHNPYPGVENQNQNQKVGVQYREKFADYYYIEMAQSNVCMSVQHVIYFYNFDENKAKL